MNNMNNKLLHLVLAILLSGLQYTASADDDTLVYGRYLLEQAFPLAYEVLRSEESSQGRLFSDSEIKDYLETQRFFKALRLRMNTDIRYVPCRLTGCRPA